ASCAAIGAAHSGWRRGRGRRSNFLSESSRRHTGTGWTPHNGLVMPTGLPPIVHCAKASLRPSLERIRSVTRAISQAPTAPGAGFPYGAATSERSSPMNELLLDYLPLVIFIAVALVIGLALLVVPFLIAYKAPDPEKLSAYECGFNAFDDARMKFDVRFYLV